MVIWSVLLPLFLCTANVWRPFWLENRHKKKQTSSWEDLKARHLPTEVEFSKVNDLPPPALGGACIVSAAWVMFSGAQGAEVAAAAVAQGEKEVPGRPQIS